MLKFKKRAEIKYDVTSEGKKIGELKQIQRTKPHFNNQCVSIWVYDLHGQGYGCYSTSLENVKKAVINHYKDHIHV